MSKNGCVHENPLSLATRVRWCKTCGAVSFRSSPSQWGEWRDPAGGFVPPGPDALERARAFFAAWDLQVRPTVYPDYTPMPMAEKQADAVQALAQALADEHQAPLHLHSIAMCKACEAVWNGGMVAGAKAPAPAPDRDALLRRAVGVLADLERSRSEVAAVLDAFAAMR